MAAAARSKQTFGHYFVSFLRENLPSHEPKTLAKDVIARFRTAPFANITTRYRAAEIEGSLLALLFTVDAPLARAITSEIITTFITAAEGASTDATANLTEFTNASIALKIAMDIDAKAITESTKQVFNPALAASASSAGAASAYEDQSLMPALVRAVSRVMESSTLKGIANDFAKQLSINALLNRSEAPISELLNLATLTFGPNFWQTGVRLSSDEAEAIPLFVRFSAAHHLTHASVIATTDWLLETFRDPDNSDTTARAANALNALMLAAQPSEHAIDADKGGELEEDDGAGVGTGAGSGRAEAPAEKMPPPGDTSLHKIALALLQDPLIRFGAAREQLQTLVFNLARKDLIERTFTIHDPGLAPVFYGDIADLEHAKPLALALSVLSPAEILFDNISWLARAAAANDGENTLQVLTYCALRELKMQFGTRSTTPLMDRLLKYTREGKAHGLHLLSLPLIARTALHRPLNLDAAWPDGAQLATGERTVMSATELSVMRLFQMAQASSDASTPSTPWQLQGTRWHRVRKELEAFAPEVMTLRELYSGTVSSLGWVAGLFEGHPNTPFQEANKKTTGWQQRFANTITPAIFAQSAVHVALAAPEIATVLPAAVTSGYASAAAIALPFALYRSPSILPMLRIIGLSFAGTALTRWGIITAASAVGLPVTAVMAIGGVSTVAIVGINAIKAFRERTPRTPFTLADVASAAPTIMILTTGIGQIYGAAAVAMSPDKVFFPTPVECTLTGICAKPTLSSLASSPEAIATTVCVRRTTATLASAALATPEGAWFMDTPEAKDAMRKAVSDQTPYALPSFLSGLLMPAAITVLEPRYSKPSSSPKAALFNGLVYALWLAERRRLTPFGSEYWAAPTEAELRTATAAAKNKFTKAAELSFIEDPSWSEEDWARAARTCEVNITLMRTSGEPARPYVDAVRRGDGKVAPGFTVANTASSNPIIVEWLGATTALHVTRNAARKVAALSTRAASATGRTALAICRRREHHTAAGAHPHQN